MKKAQQWLGGILAAQVLLGAGLLLGSGGQDGSAPEPLLDFAIDGVDRLVISSADDSTSLRKTGGQWQLQEHALPAIGTKVQGLLDNLAGLQTAWPVADTASSRERFEVSEKNFQRRLQLYQGERLLGEYYFGTSPGFRRTHGRRAGEDEVYSLAFNNVDLPAAEADWLDKTLLALNEPTRIQGPDFVLARDGTEWKLEPAEGEEAAPELNRSKVDNLVSAFDNLRIQRRAELPPAEDGTEPEVWDFEVVDADGTWQYRFTRAGDTRLAKRQDRELHFAVGSYDFDRIAGITRQDLVVAPAEPAAEADEAAASEAGEESPLAAADDTGSAAAPEEGSVDN